MALAAPALGQSRAQRAVEDLLREHPEAMVLWDEGGEGVRARALFGAPMTRAETARDAAEAFLLLYGEAFIDGEVELEESRVFPLKEGRRTVFAYRQTIEDVPVDGSIVRVMVGDDGESHPVVVYAAGHFARPPAGGLPAPLVTAGDALDAAMRHPAAELLERWAEPELVVTTESGMLARGESLLAWKVVGWSDLSKAIASYAFWVDAQTGRMIRHADRVARHDPQPSVSGTVTGGATQGTEPDKEEEHRCGENPPLTSPLPSLKVEITNAAQTQVLDTATTDDTGYYEFFGANYPSDAKIRFTWDGPAWKMHEGDTCCLYPPVPADVRSLGAVFPVVHHQDFNPSPFAEFDTAKVNAHLSLLRAWGFVHQHLGPGTYPGLDDVVHPVVDGGVVGIGCGALYLDRHALELPDALLYGRSEHDPPDCDFNRAYSTVVVHEYGHYLANRLMGIPPEDPHKQFHEGFADTLAMLVYSDTDVLTVYAENWRANCDPDRSPLTHTPRPQFDCNLSGPHDGGMLLSAIWLELAAEPASGGIGLSDAQELFVEWATLTAGGTDIGPDGCESAPKAAGLVTLIEVLTADDDDEDLSNGTPNRTTICAVFAGRLIESPPGLGLCTESAGGWSCRPDINRDGALDFFDCLGFLEWVGAADPRADWNGDGTIGADDLVRFEAAFREGC